MYDIYLPISIILDPIIRMPHLLVDQIVTRIKVTPYLIASIRQKTTEVSTPP